MLLRCQPDDGFSLRVDSYPHEPPRAAAPFCASTGLGWHDQTQTRFQRRKIALRNTLSQVQKLGRDRIGKAPFDFAELGDVQIRRGIVVNHHRPHRTTAKGDDKDRTPSDLRAEFGRH
jgi:hypothetical protein